MELAFFADPLCKFKVEKDSTFAMMAEAANRGHRIVAFEQGDFALNKDEVTVTASHIELTGKEAVLYKVPKNLRRTSSTPSTSNLDVYKRQGIYGSVLYLYSLL